VEHDDVFTFSRNERAGGNPICIDRGN